MAQVVVVVEVVAATLHGFYVLSNTRVPSVVSLISKLLYTIKAFLECQTGLAS